MKNIQMIKTLLVGVLLTGLIAGLAGCQRTAYGMQLSALAKPTLTSTATATATQTATVTATATYTATPLPTSTATPRPLPTRTTAPAQVGGGSSGSCGGGNTAFESTLLALINQERSKQGVAPLAASSSLTSVARDHSEDMATNNYFDHGDPFARMSAAGISYTAAAENIYAGSGSLNSPSAAFSGWMASDGHRTNMLNSAYTLAGVGYWCNSSSTYGGYFTLDLIHP